MTADVTRSFLFPDAQIRTNAGQTFAELFMDSSKEGWLGIPHGGIGMGAIAELALYPDADLPEPAYPINCSFRMGGAEVRVGQTVKVASEKTETGISGRIYPESNDRPYLSAVIHSPTAEREPEPPAASAIPDNYAGLQGRLTPIPYYRNCFVCGVERIHPGLRRQFHLLEGPDRLVCTFAGFDPADQETVYQFARNGAVHPMVLFSVLDETMGWGGFFRSGQGGVSVRLNYRLERSIGPDEQMVFFGRGEAVKGRIEKRMFYWASGCAAVVKPGGFFEIVARSTGQWLALSPLTAQMEKELIPRDLTRRIFEMV